MPLRSIFNHFSRHMVLPKELRWFFASGFWLRVADSFLLVVGPIYIFQLADRLPWIAPLGLDPIPAGVVTVILFYGLQRFWIVLGMPLYAAIIARGGITWSMILGIFLFGVHYALLLFTPDLPHLFWLANMVGGAGIALYWISHNTFFTTEAKMSHAGQEVSALEFLGRLATVIAPLLGALSLANFGFGITTAFGYVLFLLCIAFLLQITNLKSSLRWQWHHFWEWLQDPEQRRRALGLSGFQWENTGHLIYWPLFLYITFGRIEMVGYILSTATLISLLMVYFTGIVVDHRKNTRSITTGSGLVLASLWIPRLVFAQSPLILVASDSLDRMVSGVYNTFFTTHLIFWARGRNTLKLYIHREIAISMAYLLLSILLVLMIMVQWSWYLLFLSFMMGTAMSLFFVRTENPLSGRK